MRKRPEVRKHMRNQTDNTGEGDHNWLSRLLDTEQDTSDGVLVQSEAETEYALVESDDKSVEAMAAQVGADFDLEFVPSGYAHPLTGEYIIPTYQRGVYKGDPADQYILRADTFGVVGNMSGRYPHRDGYKHVFATLDELFPQSCESITVFGKGERAVVEQILDEPYDLGGGDIIQPYIYTRMSLNGTWKTEIIPISRRLVCENQLGYTGQLIGVRATARHDELLTMRSSVIELAVAQGTALRQMAQVLTDQDFTDGMFVEMVEHLLPRPTDPEAHARTITTADNKRGAVINRWRKEENKTMWGAYHAFQGAEQHRINANFQDTQAARDRALVKALDGKTPIADAAEEYLMSLVLVGEEPF